MKFKRQIISQTRSFIGMCVSDMVSLRSTIRKVVRGGGGWGLAGKPKKHTSIHASKKEKKNKSYNKERREMQRVSTAKKPRINNWHKKLSCKLNIQHPPTPPPSLRVITIAAKTETSHETMKMNSSLPADNTKFRYPEVISLF